MAIIKINGSEVIKLKGFKVGKEILLSDSDTMGDFEKIDVLLPKDYLEFLITDRELLKDLNIDVTVW
jgi:hypothetical protein